MNKIGILSIIILLFISFAYADSCDTIDNISVYIDYEYGDLKYIKEQISNVNYVRFKNEADVFILFTEQSTGSDGEKYTIDFTGANKFSGIDESLFFILEHDATAEDKRIKSVQCLKMGLVRYLCRTSMADKLMIIFPDHEKKEILKDKWNNWVFSTSLSGYMSGEEASLSQNFWGNVSANRITEYSKIQISFYGSMSRDRFEWDDEIYKSSSNSKSLNSYYIRSWTDHLSYGLWVYAYTSSYSNIDISIGLYPCLEYNLFPYSEANRKQLRFQYQLNPNYVNYTERTIYEKFDEKLLRHSFRTEIEYIQSWGSMSISFVASQNLVIDASVLENLDKNKLSLYGETSWRIYKGLSLNLWGNTSRVHDQLSLAAGDISTEDLLLKRKELQTQYTYFLSLGLSYSFGSIYNNIVNPRFGD